MSSLQQILLVLLLVLLMVTPLCAKTLRQSDLDRGEQPQAGDVVILDDFSRLTPSNAISRNSEKGKWWLRRYVDKSNSTEHVMLTTVQRDMDNPESCLVPPVTMPLKLKGSYEIWVGVYRPAYQGGVDVRLSRDDCPLVIDPWAVASHPGAPKPRVGALVEILYSPSSDLSRQSIIFGQPHGSYDSFHWGACEASVAYVRLVKLSSKQVRDYNRDFKDKTRRVIGFDDDNFSRYWQWGGETEADVARFVEGFKYNDIDFIGMNLGATTSLHITTPYTDKYISTDGRLGDTRFNKYHQLLLDKGIDKLAVSCKRAHKLGFKLIPTLRMSAIYVPGPKLDALSKFRTKDGMYLDYAKPEVRDYFINMIDHVVNKYDVDGFICDFSRHCVHFNADEPDKFKYMNEFTQRLRQVMDKASAKKHRKLQLIATFTSGGYAWGWVKSGGPTVVDAQGLDVATWVKNKWYDIIMPEGPDYAKYIGMTRGTGVKCYIRITQQFDLDANFLTNDVHDPTPQEDKADKPINPQLGPLDYEAYWLKLKALGADGLYIFNQYDGWTGMRRLGHLEEVKQHVESNKPYGLLEGPMIELKD